MDDMPSFDGVLTGVNIGEASFDSEAVAAVRLDRVGGSRARTINFRPEKASPDSSPKVAPDGQFGGDHGAMRRLEKELEKNSLLPRKTA